MRLRSPAAATGSLAERTRVLDPTDRTAEVLFGLIMVLTFTGSLSVAQAGRDDVRAMEALRTASLWAGYAMRGGRRLEWELTPMVGAVFGAIDGVAPGYLASLSWWKVDAYIEGEYVFARTPEDRFAYHWSEAAIAPLDWLRGGLATQRTRAYATDRNIQRGPFVNATFARLDAAGYMFIGAHSKPTFVLSMGWSV